MIVLKFSLAPHKKNIAIDSTAIGMTSNQFPQQNMTIGSINNNDNIEIIDVIKFFLVYIITAPRTTTTIAKVIPKVLALVITTS